MAQGRSPAAACAAVARRRPESSPGWFCARRQTGLRWTRPLHAAVPRLRSGLAVVRRRPGCAEMPRIIEVCPARPRARPPAACRITAWWWPTTARTASPRLREPMPAVRDLHRRWGPLPHAIGISPGPVASDDLHAGMLTQPRGQGLGLAVGQQVDNRVALQVDQDGAVAVATAPGPIVDGNHPRRIARHVVIAGLAGQTQQRVGTHGHGQPRGQALAGLAAKRQTEAALQDAQALGSPRGGRAAGQAFGEGLAGTGGIEAAKPACVDLQGHRTALPRQVSKRAQGSAMQPLGWLSADRAYSGRLLRLGLDDDGVGIRHDLVDR